MRGKPHQKLFDCVNVVLERALLPFQEREGQDAAETMTTHMAEGLLSPWPHLRGPSGSLPGQAPPPRLSRHPVLTTPHL